MDDEFQGSLMVEKKIGGCSSTAFKQWRGKGFLFSDTRSYWESKLEEIEKLQLKRYEIASEAMRLPEVIWVLPLIYLLEYRLEAENFDLAQAVGHCRGYTVLEWQNWRPTDFQHTTSFLLKICARDLSFVGQEAKEQNFANIVLFSWCLIMLRRQRPVY